MSVKCWDQVCERGLLCLQAGRRPLTRNENQITDGELPILRCAVGLKTHTVWSNAQGVQGQRLQRSVFVNEIGSSNILDGTSNCLGKNNVSGKTGPVTGVKLTGRESVRGFISGVVTVLQNRVETFS